MADVFRKGRKSVHRAIVSGDPDDPASPNQCRLDGRGNAWLAEQPPGPECVVCFAGLSDDRKSGTGPVQVPPRNTRPRSQLALATGAIALAFLGGVWASPDQRPMISYTASTVPSTTPSWAAPSATAGIPEQTPAPTPTDAVPTLRPGPVVVVRVVERRIVEVVEVRPGPTPPPTPKPCIHPGLHLGNDGCHP